VLLEGECSVFNLQINPMKKLISTIIILTVVFGSFNCFSKIADAQDEIPDHAVIDLKNNYQMNALAASTIMLDYHRRIARRRTVWVMGYAFTDEVDRMFYFYENDKLSYFLDEYNNRFEVSHVNDRINYFQDSNGYKLYLIYDQNERVEHVVDENFNKIYFEYDDIIGDLTAVKITDDFGNSAEFFYDSNNRLDYIQDNNGYRIFFRYSYGVTHVLDYREGMQSCTTYSDCPANSCFGDEQLCYCRQGYQLNLNKTDCVIDKSSEPVPLCNYDQTFNYRLNICQNVFVQAPNTNRSLNEYTKSLNYRLNYARQKIYTDKPSEVPVGYLIKAYSDIKCYLVMADKTLRWVISEEVAERLLGSDWNNQIIWLEESLVYTYNFGEPIDE